MIIRSVRRFSARYRLIKAAYAFQSVSGHPRYAMKKLLLSSRLSRAFNHAGAMGVPAKDALFAISIAIHHNDIWPAEAALYKEPGMHITIHPFLYDWNKGQERLSPKTSVVQRKARKPINS